MTYSAYLRADPDGIEKYGVFSAMSSDGELNANWTAELLPCTSYFACQLRVFRQRLNCVPAMAYH